MYRMFYVLLVLTFLVSLIHNTIIDREEESTKIEQASRNAEMNGWGDTTVEIRHVD